MDEQYPETPQVDPAVDPVTSEPDAAPAEPDAGVTGTPEPDAGLQQQDGASEPDAVDTTNESTLQAPDSLMVPDDLDDPAGKNAVRDLGPSEGASEQFLAGQDQGFVDGSIPPPPDATEPDSGE